MGVKFRTAHYCANCWHELGALDRVMTLYGCPRCSAPLEDAVFSRAVPHRRSALRTGLEPVFALWREALLALHCRNLRIRIAQLNPTDMQLPRLRMKLARLEALQPPRG